MKVKNYKELESFVMNNGYYDVLTEIERLVCEYNK
jgi:hypothetical protein